MRVLISFLTFMIFVGSSVVSGSADYVFNSEEGVFVRIPEHSCYNYTFIDGNSELRAFIEEERMEASLDSPDNVFYDTEQNLCKDRGKVLKAGLSKTASEDSRNEESGRLSAEVSLLPNPEIGFVEEGDVQYSDYEFFRARKTIFYGGVLPFIAIPDDELANDDHFFNEDSISLFLYFKRKF